MIKTFEIPHRIVSDMGTSFTSEKVKAFVDETQAIHHLTALSMPCGNGQVERYNQTILSSLATMGADCDDDRLDENIVNIQVGLNGTINRAIGVTPSQALMGYRVVTTGTQPDERAVAEKT
jgi:hypothetical protein